MAKVAEMLFSWSSVRRIVSEFVGSWPSFNEEKAFSEIASGSSQINELHF